MADQSTVNNSAFYVYTYAAAALLVIFFMIKIIAICVSQCNRRRRNAEIRERPPPSISTIHNGDHSLSIVVDGSVNGNSIHPGDKYIDLPPTYEEVLKWNADHLPAPDDPPSTSNPNK